MVYTLTSGEGVVRGTAFLKRYSFSECLVLATHQQGGTYLVGYYGTEEQAQEIINEINAELTCGAIST